MINAMNNHSNDMKDAIMLEPGLLPYLALRKVVENMPVYTMHRQCFNQ